MAKEKPKEVRTLAQARERYIRGGGEITLKQLAKEYEGVKGCTYKNLKYHSAKQGWVKQRDQFMAELRLRTNEKVIESLSGMKARHLSTLFMLHDKWSKEFEAMKKTDLNAKSLGQMLLKIIHLEQDIRCDDREEPGRKERGPLSPAKQKRLLRLIRAGNRANGEAGA